MFRRSAGGRDRSQKDHEPPQIPHHTAGARAVALRPCREFSEGERGGDALGAELAQRVLLDLTGIGDAVGPPPWRRVLMPWRLGRAPIPASHVARVLLLRDRRGHALALIPADRRIDLTALAGELGRSFQIVEASRRLSEMNTSAFLDEGRIDTFVDTALLQLPVVYLPAGSPDQGLARVDSDTFRRLFYGTWSGCISRPST
jgi:hypothetical protein